MSGYEFFTCQRCDRPFSRQDDAPEEFRDTVCPVCRKLGDRSLLWYQREMKAAETDEQKAALRKRFASARGRSWMLPDVLMQIKQGRKLPPGLYQMGRENESRRRDET